MSFPNIPVPSGETQITFLRAQVAKGAHGRYRPITDRVRRQLERELRLIEKLNLAGYFLIVWDLIEFCRENQFLCRAEALLPIVRSVIRWALPRSIPLDGFAFRTLPLRRTRGMARYRPSIFQAEMNVSE